MIGAVGVLERAARRPADYRHLGAARRQSESHAQNHYGHGSHSNRREHTPVQPSSLRVWTRPGEPDEKSGHWQQDECHCSADEHRWDQQRRDSERNQTQSCCLSAGIALLEHPCPKHGYRGRKSDNHDHERNESEEAVRRRLTAITEVRRTLSDEHPRNRRQNRHRNGGVLKAPQHPQDNAGSRWPLSRRTGRSVRLVGFSSTTDVTRRTTARGPVRRRVLSLRSISLDWVRHVEPATAGRIAECVVRAGQNRCRDEYRCREMNSVVSAQPFQFRELGSIGDQIVRDPYEVQVSDQQIKFGLCRSVLASGDASAASRCGERCSSLDDDQVR